MRTNYKKIGLEVSGRSKQNVGRRTLEKRGVAEEIFRQTKKKIEGVHSVRRDFLMQYGGKLTGRTARAEREDDQRNA